MNRCRRSWPVQGTTGYDFLNQVNGLFVAGAHEHFFTDVYAKTIDRQDDLCRSGLWLQAVDHARLDGE